VRLQQHYPRYAITNNYMATIIGVNGKALYILMAYLSDHGNETDGGNCLKLSI
jgi:hypothetical protein